ncbi:hypothetical protein BGZ61DRAFT_473242 [Ilyonectria robusta]|uniref:uncharacterized protein n=1 Tax=Ilyonectria robusta TaxID=1079257 RepID=UPI001E8DB6C8|nr:uncharacterized protein BGZ61DRAFT_473242 [Ilyonectria robusta]KAH8734512.1 hypothetical protein BGZ61DRAFT_473242 [Ilyonectria robusta]
MLALDVRGWFRRLKRHWTYQRFDADREMYSVGEGCGSAESDWETYDSTSTSEYESAHSGSIGHTQSSGKRFNPESKLDRMPMEILIMIDDHLTNASRMAFALTCRSIYPVHFDANKYPPLYPSLVTRKDREEFLQLLEKDVANLFFCHTCTVLHSWSTNWGISGSARLSYKPCKDWNYQQVTLCGIDQLKFCAARLFINCHLYGPAHGLPLSKLERQSNTTSPSGVHMQVVRRGRILEDELFILVTYTIKGSQGRGGSLRRFMEQSDITICNHVHATDDSSTLYDWKAGKLRSHSLDVPLVPCETTTESCPMCLTDYSVQITRLEQGQGWTVVLDVYKQLGGCRSPYDWKWRCASERSFMNEPRSINNQAGVVRNRWATADGMKRSVAKFVGRPNNMKYFIVGIRRCPWNSFCKRGSHDCAKY